MVDKDDGWENHMENPTDKISYMDDENGALFQETSMWLVVWSMFFQYVANIYPN